MEDIVSGTYFADDTGKIMIVKLQGYIDQTNSYGLQKVFDDIINSGCYNVIIDFSEVMYISSAGWGIFVGEIKHFRDESGDIKLANMSPDIYEVYQMLEFYHIFEDYNSIENAKNSFTELELTNDKPAPINNIEEKSLEIDLDDESENDFKRDNVLEISMGNPQGEITDSQKNYTNESEKVSDKIDITIDENLDSDVETIDLNSLDFDENLKSSSSNENSKPAIDLSRLPLYEKIKKLVAEYPFLSIWKIKKLLRDSRFGSVKINIYKLYKALKELDLETKLKRYRYFRSC
jgi:anti-sigma B factor antagonist